MEIRNLIREYLSNGNNLCLKELKTFSNIEIIKDLSLQFSEDELIEFIKKFYSEPYEGKIHTIGMFYYRLYDGGTEKVVSLLAKLWTQMGYDVILYTDSEPNKADYELPAEVKRYVLQHTCAEAKTKECIYARAEELYGRFKEDKIDVLIYHAWMESSLIWDMLVAKTLRIPFAMYSHGVFATIYHNIDENTFRWPQIYRLCDKIVCLARVSEEYYKQLGCNVSFIHNPIDEKLDLVERSSLDGKSILWIGRLSVEKHPLDAIKVFEKVYEAHRDAELYLVGGGCEEWVESLNKAIKGKSWESKIHLCGYQKDVDEYYRKASVMMMTSDFEGYPTTLVESKAYGVPCVMYDLPYLSLVEDNKGIESVPISATDAMAHKISQLLDDDAYRKTMGTWARESYVSNRNYDLSGRWKQVFEDIEKNTKTYNDPSQQMMLDLLLTHTEIGYTNRINEIENSREMSVGRKVTNALRPIWRLVRKPILYFKRIKSG